MVDPEQETGPFAQAMYDWFRTAGLSHLMWLSPGSGPTMDSVTITLFGCEGRLDGWASWLGLEIAAMKDGKIWDFVYNEDISPAQDDKGWYCEMCKGEARIHYPTEMALLRAHMFEPFAQWAKKTLEGGARVLFQSQDGMTWAKLVPASAGDTPDASS